MIEKDREFLQAYLQDRRNLVEEALQEYLAGLAGEREDIYRAIHYSVFAGGKRIRPILCLAAVDALGGNLAVAMPVACALEFIHTYSLIHDDLPAMDDDDLRRGKPTSHKVFGEALAILAGDGLLTEAFVLLSRAEKIMLPAQKRLNIIHEIAYAAGVSGMVGGQVLDILCEKIAPDENILSEIHRRKTGALIVASLNAASIICGATKSRKSALSDYGLNVGMAFQIADDILNVTGDSLLLGKETGSDAARGKMTYPSVLGIEEAKRKLHQHVEEAIGSLADFDERARPLRLIARYIEERQK
ncbi:MAG TPA: polyprenyl synthetase family protein [Smithellaceae bacterium]|nr:polyprenyl synthetase family protein [Smithellaceae bacterium]HRS88811.1 polyprenyl synthetase family protein [Smithellaceae bacterium]HRV25753.1 polyprenyl synthetase family protein [Smithellaceae bacterium]